MTRQRLEQMGAFGTDPSVRACPLSGWQHGIQRCRQFFVQEIEPYGIVPRAGQVCRSQRPEHPLRPMPRVLGLERPGQLADVVQRDQKTQRLPSHGMPQRVR